MSLCDYRRAISGCQEVIVTLLVRKSTQGDDGESNGSPLR